MPFFPKPGITASEFAVLCGTNRRTLLHYDEIGLFSPAARGENGYRYYQEDQYDVFLVIRALKELGMPLEQIKAYLDNRSPETLDALLVSQERRVIQELQALERIRKMIATKRQLLALGVGAECGTVRLEWQAEEYILLSEPIFSRDPEKRTDALYAHLAKCHRENRNIGYPFGAMVSEESLHKQEFDCCAYCFTRVEADGPEITVKPAGNYAVIYFRGDYLQAEQAFHQLLGEVETMEKSICGFAYKEGILDEIAEKDKKCYLTKISVRVV